MRDYKSIIFGFERDIENYKGLKEGNRAKALILIIHTTQTELKHKPQLKQIQNPVSRKIKIRKTFKHIQLFGRHNLNIISEGG